MDQYQSYTPSIGDLTAAMEIPRQSLYNLFGSKRHLFLCALTHYDREFRQTTRSELAARASPRGAVLELLDDVVSSVVHNGCHDGCFVVNAALEMAPHDTDVAAFVVGVFAVEADFFRDAIERAQTLGDISAEVAPERVAKSLVGLSAESGPSRSPNPAQADHPFRFKPITDSGRTRSAFPVPSRSLFGGDRNRSGRPL